MSQQHVGTKVFEARGPRGIWDTPHHRGRFGHDELSCDKAMNGASTPWGLAPDLLGGARLDWPVQPIPIEGGGGGVYGIRVSKRSTCNNIACIHRGIYQSDITSCSRNCSRNCAILQYN